MPLLLNIRVLDPVAGDPIRDAALAWNGDRITYVGPRTDAPSGDAMDAGGRVVVPGLVDCHTHLAFGGWRADEFVERCRGATYSEIAAKGGGIASTVRRTREATQRDLTRRALRHLDAMLALGVTTVECKSGYGLSVEDELKLLRVYRGLRAATPATLVTTFLGAHVVPPEYRDDRAGYLRLLIEEMIPRVAAEKLATYCDVFVEGGAFTTDEARTIFAAAKAHGLRPKLHADQLADGNGAALAAEVGAASADHLEYVSDEGLRAMAAAESVAVLLPIATLYLRQPPLDARRCHAAGVEMAVATDFNPGSAPSYHLPLAMMLACSMNRLTPRESLRAATLGGAKAIGLEREVGSLEVGKRADFVLLDAESVEEWLYHFRPNSAAAVVAGGKLVAGTL